MTARALRALRPGRRDALPAACGALGAALVLAREATYGAVLHWDSINYIGVARSLAAGEGFTEFDGTPFTSWPPLYPLLLAVPAVLRIDPLDAAGPLNAALSGLTVFAAGRWLWGRLESRLLAILCGLALATAMPLVGTASWALSETPFILFVTLALIGTDRLLRDGTAPALALAAAFTALACLTRWHGVGVIFAVVPLLALQRGVALPSRARRIAAYAAISAAPLGLWMLRHLLVTGRPLPSRGTHAADAAGLLDATLGVTARWLLPDTAWTTDSLPARALAGAGLIALAAAVAYLAASGRRNPGARSRRGAFVVFGGFAAAYLAFHALSWAASGFADNSSTYRYLAPVFLPLLVAVALALDGLLAWARERWKRPRGAGAALTAAAAALLVLWIAASAPGHASAIREANAEGFLSGYSNARWARSETIGRLREEPPNGGRIFSNSAAAAYIYTPWTRDGPRHEALARGLDRLRRQIGHAAGGSLFVWFRDWFVDFGYGLDDLRGVRGLEPVADLDDGAVFRRLDHPFTVRLEGNALIYERDGCDPADTWERFFVHAVPADEDELPPGPRPNLNFWFAEWGVLEDGRCEIVRPLPRYRIASVETGQYDADDTLWSIEFRPGEADDHR